MRKELEKDIGGRWEVRLRRDDEKGVWGEVERRCEGSLWGESVRKGCEGWRKNI